MKLVFVPIAELKVNDVAIFEKLQNKLLQYKERKKKFATSYNFKLLDTIYKEKIVEILLQDGYASVANLQKACEEISQLYNNCFNKKIFDNAFGVIHYYCHKHLTKSRRKQLQII